LLTFLAVMIGWVFFRSANLATAQGILTSMASLSQLGGWSRGVDPQLAVLDVWRVALLLSVAAAVAFLLPNSVQITEAASRAAQERDIRSVRLVSASMAAFGLLFGVSVVCIGRASPFLYFQF
jgi:alginate O-acetyltransferase complex protein AlgI